MSEIDDGYRRIEDRRRLRVARVRMRQIAGRSLRRNKSEMILRSRFDELAVLDLDVDAAAGPDGSQHPLGGN